MKPGRRGIARLVHATNYSWRGLRAAFHHEAAFRQELVLVLAGVPLALWLGETAPERALLIASLLLVLVTELLNSALEAVVDRIGDEPHPLSGRAKDMGSAAVLVALVIAALCWGLVLFGGP